MQHKLAGWKNAQLSLAGRKVLIQLVTSSILAYAIQSTLLPKATCDVIDRLNRDFLWGSNLGARKPHLVSWKVVCSKKKFGGLGLRTAGDNNRAFVTKLGWHILHGDSSLWCKVMRAKYLKGQNLLETTATSSASFIWRGMIQCSPILQLGICWRIGSGERVSFWKDTWARNAPLFPISSSGESSVLCTLKAANVITPNKEWDLATLSGLVSKDSIEAIRVISLSRTSQLPDRIFWMGSMDGSFTVKSTYQLIQGSCQLMNSFDESWDWIWKLPCIERIRVFVWLLVRGWVLINSVRFARRMASSPICPRCESSNETPIHLLRDCYYAKLI
ncbi:hypothetical protein SLA2020_332950 [Shorea laevis]